MSLYRRYIDGTLSKEEYTELRSQMMNPQSQQQIATEMEHAFLKTSEFEEIPDAARERIRKNIKRNVFSGTLRTRILQWVSIAAVIMLPIFMVTTFYFYSRLQASDGMSASILVEKGQKASITLPDGSTVSLNGGSSLAYDFNKVKKRRHVQLIGEAFFDVKHDETSPFILETTDIEVEVLGTTFNVNAYSDNNTITVALEKGKVKLQRMGDDNRGKSVYLSPSQQYTFDRTTGKGEISFMDKDAVLGWKNGDLIFVAEPLEGIFKKIERWYGVHIEADLANIEKDNFTGTFKSISALEVMNILQVHYNFRYKMENNTISIY